MSLWYNTDRVSFIFQPELICRKHPSAELHILTRAIPLSKCYQAMINGLIYSCYSDSTLFSRPSKSPIPIGLLDFL
ncbi:MAG TPA: hypothetical protein PK323_15020, partial [Bacteroidia bacterium]|nr:hypothetical protein [Bacteroidia bacterium]